MFRRVITLFFIGIISLVSINAQLNVGYDGDIGINFLALDSQIDWNDLFNVPEGFADNIDNVSAGDGGGNPFDQWLNTTSDVFFNSVNASMINATQGYFTNLNVTNLGGWSPINVKSNIIFEENTTFENLLNCPIIYTDPSGDTFCTDSLNITNINVTNFAYEFLNVTINASDVEDIWVNETGDTMIGDLNITAGNDLLVNTIAPTSGIAINFTFDVDDPQKASLNMINLGDGDLEWNFVSAIGGSIFTADDIYSNHNLYTNFLLSIGGSNLDTNLPNAVVDTIFRIRNSLSQKAHLVVEGNITSESDSFCNGTTCYTLEELKDEEPVGVVKMFYLNDTYIPSGWVICNGTNNTPDLRDKFILSAGTTYSFNTTGGSTSHNHTSGSLVNSNSGNHSHEEGSLTPTGTPSATITTGLGLTLVATGTHTHTLKGNVTYAGNHTHTISGNVSQTTTLPPYYVLYYICKVS